MGPPPYGRKATFEKSIELLKNRMGPLILEIGVARDEESWLVEGHSTPFFAWFIMNHGGKFIAVDVDQNSIQMAHTLLKKYGLEGNCELICCDAINFVQNFNNKIDLLYLDGWDYSLDIGSHADEIRSSSEKNHLECFKKSEHLIKENGMVLVDDIFDHESYYGKGRLLIPYMIKNGYIVNQTSYDPLEYGNLGGNFPDHIHQFLMLKL
jgi:hypothetical protein